VNAWIARVLQSKRFLWIVIGVALLVRACYALRQPMDERDADVYRELGHNLAAGRGYTYYQQGADTRWPPLVPWMLAAVYKLGGNDLAARQLWAWLGTFCVLAAFALVNTPHERMAANLAALGMALYPYNILMGGSTSTETPNILLILTGFGLLRRWIRTGTSTVAVLLGVVLGLAVLNRPAMVAYGLLCLVIMVSRGHPLVLRKRVLGTSLCAMIAVVVALPWCIRTSRLAGEPSLTATAGAWVLWEGNNPWIIDYTEGRLSSATFGSNLTAVASAPGLSPAEKNAAYRAAAFRFFREQTGEALRVLACKTVKFWQIPGTSTVATTPSARKFKWAVIAIGCISYVPVAIGCGWGIIYLTPRGALGRIAFYLTWIGIAYLTSIGGASVTRYRFLNGVDCLMIVIFVTALAVRSTTGRAKEFHQTIP